MRRVIISSATSPSAGMSSEAISGEEVLECGKICVANFSKFLNGFIPKLKDDHFLNKRVHPL